VMVNNAAIQVEQELAETTEEQLDRVLAVNLKGPFFGCKHAVRVMRESGGGAIVNVASILALVGDGILAAYCAAKGGVLGVTRATAVRYGADGIRCNAICPGDIDTPLVQAISTRPAILTLCGGRSRPSIRSDGSRNPARSRERSSSSHPTTPRS
jgi:meso-butanediol dehydrogenase / (S,S)-butanediol dehydrogenase / diacetyl reductase